MKEIICKEEISGGLFMHTIYEPVQELIRCKDCIHMKDDGSIPPLIWCSIHEFGRMNDYFCADAIRKKGQ